MLAPLPCSCIETNYLRTRLTDATSRSSSRHRASRDQLPETTTRRIRRTAGVFGRQTCGRCRRPSLTMLHWTALQHVPRRNERKSARACSSSLTSTTHFGIDTMAHLIYFKCRECGEVFTRFEDRFSVIHFLTMEPHLCPRCFSRRTHPGGMGWIFRLIEWLRRNQSLY